ncbi:polysaccharide deacetylase family protein [Paenibacillus protaetiae]|uniref:NodB homology domain-containing protein n=1 Tax=Paenibacillus protaetiae TaxID=2509456 RepID=A0A4V0YEW6_9BACL|nr:polysaccharide deacetylase family protein [Paenibacillus protaetiae]QAY65641.1 hypothetical protein ET464_03840 [Paenibacillus protaetiae]
MHIRKIGLAAATVAALLLFIGLGGGGISSYINAMKQNNMAAFTEELSESDKQQLLAAIKLEADKRREAPVNARIDRVWKAIPGYNGIEVDVEQTYEKTLQSGSTRDIQYVYKEIPPAISLRDLGPLPIYKGNPNKKMISFMINVAWGNEYLDSILDTLDREQVKATFFLDGSWLKKNPELAKKIQERGHELSNHAYSHPNMSQLNRAQQNEQIMKTESLLKSTLGVTNHWFAPPSGDFNQLTVQVAAEQKLMTVMWTIDTVDWKKPSPEWIVNKITSKLEPGALILMHPTASSSAALPAMIKAAKQKGYAIGTVSDTLSSKRVFPPG